MNPYKDYSEFLKLLEDTTLNKDDVYQQIISKEKNALEVINRVSQNLAEKKKADLLFYNMTVLDIIAMLTNTWKNMLNELVANKSTNILPIVWKGDRKIYTGITIVMVALILFFLDVSR